MEFGQAFSFPFKDPDWLKKIALPAVVFLIPIIGPLVLFGWGLTIAKRVLNNDPTPLPELDFGNQLSLGFKGFIIAFVFSLPSIIFQIPIQAVGPAATAADFDEQTLTMIILVISICCGGLQLIYSLIIAFLIPAALGNFLAKGELSAGFKLGEVFGLVRAAPVPYLLVVLGGLLASFIGSLGVIACVIGVIFTLAYGQAITAHLTGQAYNQASKALVAE